MRGLVVRKLHPAMSDSRLAHASHRHHPHSAQSYPSHGLAPAYPSHSTHPSYSHHPSRHMPNGPSAPVLVSAHQGMPMGGPSDGIGPPPVSAMGNGHGHVSPANGPGVSPTARAAKEKMDNVLSQLATANENTWMLIGAPGSSFQNMDWLMNFEQAPSPSRCRIKTEPWRHSRTRCATIPLPFSRLMPSHPLREAETTSTRRSSTFSGSSTSSRIMGRFGAQWVNQPFSFGIMDTDSAVQVIAC